MKIYQLEIDLHLRLQWFPMDRKLLIKGKWNFSLKTKENCHFQFVDEANLFQILRFRCTYLINPHNCSCCGLIYYKFYCNILKLENLVTFRFKIVIRYIQKFFIMLGHQICGKSLYNNFTIFNLIWWSAKIHSHVSFSFYGKTFTVYWKFEKIYFIYHFFVCMWIALVFEFHFAHLGNMNIFSNFQIFR